MQLVLALTLLGLLLVLGGFLVRPGAPVRYRAERRGSTAILRPPRGRYALLGTLALLPVALLVGVGYTAAREGSSGWGGWVLEGALVAVGLAAAGWLFAGEFRNQVRVSDEAVERLGPTLHRRLPWVEVARVQHNGVNRWFVLTAASGSRLWISESLGGIGDFADAALARLRPEVLRADATAREALEQIAAEARLQDAASR